MKNTLQAGVTRQVSVPIDASRTIDFLGEQLRVYATPALVRDFEVLCRELLLEHCDSGEDSVGTGICISHTGATLLGMNVALRAEVTAIDRRLVKFALSAHDGVESVSAGEHTRAVVEVEKLRTRLAAKAAAAKAS
ncbi:MAG: LysR family transcriptional regulator [Gammaproteobacteria bacterium]|nr:LysR family transcriptional regulator [Gammaproteobacteria bacterium]